jgi:acetoin utilization protein AcuB
MLIRDIMTTNVVSIPSSTSLAEARTIMDVHRIRRLPVIDRGKLVGIVTKSALDKAGPSELTTFSRQELTYLLEKVTVKEVMNRVAVIISPDTTVEEAITLALARKSRSLLVINDNHLVGIVTTYDFLYKVLNPILAMERPLKPVFVH